MSTNKDEKIQATYYFNDITEISEVPSNYNDLKGKIMELFKINENELKDYDITYQHKDDKESYIVNEETYKVPKLISEEIVFNIKPKEYTNEDEYNENNEREIRRGKGRVRPGGRGRFRQNNRDREEEDINDEEDIFSSKNRYKNEVNNNGRGGGRGKGRVRPGGRGRFRQNNRDREEEDINDEEDIFSSKNRYKNEVNNNGRGGGRGKGRVRPGGRDRFRQNNDRDREEEDNNYEENERYRNEDDNNGRGRGRGKGRVRPGGGRDRFRQNNDREREEDINDEENERYTNEDDNNGRGRVRPGGRDRFRQNNDRNRENEEERGRGRGRVRGRARGRFGEREREQEDRYGNREDEGEKRRGRGTRRVGRDYRGIFDEEKGGPFNDQERGHYFRGRRRRGRFRTNRIFDRENNKDDDNNNRRINFNDKFRNKNKPNKKNDYYDNFNRDKSNNKEYDDEDYDNNNNFNKKKNSKRKYNNDNSKEKFSNYDFRKKKNNDDNNDNDSNEETDIKKESQHEMEIYMNNFKKQYRNIIDEMNNLFFGELKEEEIIDILKNMNLNPSLTIFEAMNFIYRESQIIKTLNYYKSNKNRVYGPEKDIFEEKYISYLNKDNLKNIIENYKIYEDNQDNELDNSWLYIDSDDRRRKLIKDENNYYNYLPLLNPDDNDEYIDDESIYSNNENELLYHSLYYKTLLCRHCDFSEDNNINEEKIKLCPYAHNILKDFRVIYDYRDEKIIKFMLLLLENNNLFKFENYINYIPMSLSPEFNIDTFKVHKCQLEENCPNDYHLCPYYHKFTKGDEQRRPPLLFGYNNTTGNKCFDKKQGKYHPKKCSLGIFCPFVHSRNEYNYHPDNFRKKYKCERQKNYGKCMFYKTCYGIHPNEDNNESSEEEIEEEEINLEEIEEDEEVKEISSKVSNIVKLGKYLRCRKCQKVSKIGELCYFIECNHFLCTKCFKKMNKDNKDNKENKKLLCCPFCGKELKKEGVVSLNFNKNKK